MLNDTINIPDWLTQQEACKALGVRRQTLYAYASRGQIDVRKDPAKPGHSLYRGLDIKALLGRRDVGRTRKTIAASTMTWGEPIMATRVSTIARGRLYYRGQDAMVFAETATLEEAAQLLWACPEVPFFPTQEPVPGHGSPRARAYASLGVAAAEGLPAHALSAASMCRQAAGLVGLLASSFMPLRDDQAPLHLRVARAGKCLPSADLLRRALVLMADQELTTSAFAARVTASTGASLGASALAGLAALSGPLHGDATVRVNALLENVRRLGAEAAVRGWLSTGNPLPGFGHQLYPDGDPRARALLAAFEPSPQTRALIECVQSLVGLQPTIDVALAALVEYCDLPDGSAFALFAIGRGIGWMAHCMEQIASGSLLRPRAQYIGPPIAASASD